MLSKAWLTADSVEKILKKSESDESIQVEDLTIAPAVAKGENYGSEMIRATVKYSHNGSNRKTMKTVSLVYKIAHTEGIAKEMLAEFDVFKREINMMQMTLAEMNAILNEKNNPLSPRVLYAEIGDPSYIVMEDLASLGYRMGDRQVGLDLEHCLLTMRNLAKFHASSIVLFEKGTELHTAYDVGVFHPDCPRHFQDYCKNSLRGLAKEILNWPELGTDQHSYSEKLLKLSEVCFDKGVKCVNQKGNEFNVLNHGDCWLNNMLFRYDGNGKVTDHIFVDFQLPYWNSPAIDIHNFFSTSPSEDVEIHHRQALVKEYCDTLTKTMSKLHCKTKPPTAEALHKSLSNYEFYSVLSTCLFLPIIVLDKSDAVSLNELVQDDTYVSPAYKGQPFRRRLLRRLPAWNARGLLNV